MLRNPNFEPLTFAVGDTLQWHRYLSCYLPSSGWQLQYQIVGGANALDGQQNTAFASTPDSTNTVHEIVVTAATTAQWAAGIFLLVGNAVNAGLSQSIEIYRNTVILTPNFNTAVDNVAIQTHAQKMIAALEAQTLVLAAQTIQATTVQETEIVRKKADMIDKQLAFYREKRANEIAQENVNNGRPSGQKIRPFVNIVTPGPMFGFGRAWPFIPNS